MRIPAIILCLMGLSVSSIAAPAPARLVSRGEIRPEIAEFTSNSTRTIQIQFVDSRFRAVIQAQAAHIKANPMTESSWLNWRIETIWSSRRYKKELSLAINEFDKKYETFKSDIKTTMSGNIHSDGIALPEWDMRFHIAYIWDRLYWLQKDIRADLLLALLELTTALSTDCGFSYTVDPEATIELVLKQTEVLMHYYAVKSQEFNAQVVRVHRMIDDHIDPEWSTYLL